MTATVDDHLLLALDRFEARVAQVTQEQLERPTPCADWDVRDLLQHLTYELAWSVHLLDGATLDEVGDRYDTDLLGEDPAAAINARGRTLRERLRRGDTAETVHTSQGPLPRDQYLGQLTFDLTVHGWDLAVATGQDPQLEPALVDVAMQTAEHDVPQAREVGIFTEPPVDPDEQPDRQARLLALTGRDPGWSPPG